MFDMRGDKRRREKKKLNCRACGRSSGQKGSDAAGFHRL